VLEHLPLLHLRHSSTATGHTVTCTRRAVTAPVCARKPPCAAESRATCTVHTGRASAVEVGHTLLYNWAERGFGPVAVELVFYFPNTFKFLQI
jgi:hypothetical protein